jgi:hypothetical protein
MVERAKVIEALTAYKARLAQQGKTARAAAVAHCIAIVRRL